MEFKIMRMEEITKGISMEIQKKNEPELSLKPK